MNLGDWPLNVVARQEPFPVFSWCGSDATRDIIWPTWDLMKSTIMGMDRSATLCSIFWLLSVFPCHTCRFPTVRDISHASQFSLALMFSPYESKKKKYSCLFLCREHVCMPHYSGTPLMWTPWGPGEVSCIEKCPHFRGKFIHIWDTAKYSTEVSLFQGCPSRGVPLYLMHPGC